MTTDYFIHFLLGLGIGSLLGLYIALVCIIQILKFQKKEVRKAENLSWNLPKKEVGFVVPPIPLQKKKAAKKTLKKSEITNENTRK